jgi:hypothetical protein
MLRTLLHLIIKHFIAGFSGVDGVNVYVKGNGLLLATFN